MASLTFSGSTLGCALPVRPQEGRNESVTVARQGLDKARILRRIVQRFAQPFHRDVDTVLKITIGFAGPEFGLQLLPCYDLAGLLQEHGENPKRLFLQLDLDAAPAQFTGTQVEFENTETQFARG